jgi:sugar/nucleoside kinase (ribokinase family)
MKDRPPLVEFVAVGHLAIDLIGEIRVLGGTAAYGSLTAARMGLSTAIVTAIGDDFHLLEALKGIDVHFDRKGQSTIFENVYAGTTRHQRLLGRARSLVEEDLVELEPRVADDCIVLYCPIAREIKAPIRRLKPKGLCGLAPQGFFRSWDGEGRVHPAFWEDAESQLAGVDILCLSAADPPSLPRFLEQALELVPTVAVTEGKLGVRVYADGRCFNVPAFPSLVVDPTGAGDVFAASLLVALRQGMSPLDGAQFACCAASYAVERKGVAGVPPSLEAVEERLEVYRSRFTPEEISP